MTSVGTFTGTLDKPSTKVMAPPGGRSQIFGSAEPVLPSKNTNRKNQSTFAFGSGEDASNVVTKRPNSLPVQPKTNNQPAELPVQQTAPQQPVQQTEPQQPAGQKPSTKVMAPPGGASSISFGGDPTPAYSRPAAGRSSSSNLFGGSDGAPPIGQRAVNRRPPGGESNNIFG